MNEKKLFNENWFFKLKGEKSPNPVTLPHDWLIYDTKNLYKESVGIYTKKFLVDEKFTNHFLNFGAIYMDSSIYINGKLAFEWKFGYTSFSFEITDFLVDGENEIEVYVNYEAGNSRWYSGAGIYRDVYIVSTMETYVENDSIYISPKRLGNNIWEVNINLNVHGNYSKIEHTYFYDSIECEKKCENIIENPHLWSVNEPNLYTLLTEVYNGEEVIYSEKNTFGFREVSFNREKGFFLNSNHMKINGVCLHHDLGSLGAAFHKDALKRQFDILKEMGVNALRTAHNPPDKYFMQLADEMGFLVVSEIFDMWERPKTPKDYARFFKDWWRKDIKSWVMRDRNHPSLIMWSIGNEIYDTHESVENGTKILKMLQEETRLFDYNKNAFITIGSNYLPWENTVEVFKSLEEPKLVGYNYGEYLYEEHYDKHKDFYIYGSETASVVQSRGIYHFPLAKSVLADDDEQCSSLGNSATSWGAKSTESAVLLDRTIYFSLGQFIWSGIDYIGEPTPYHTKNSYFGQIDTAGFKKDSFYIYKAVWTDYKENPFVHIFPYWDFSDGQTIDVQVVSNAPYVELYLDDILQKHSKKDENQVTYKYSIPYKKGELKAVCYDENKNIIATSIEKSFTDAISLKYEVKRYDDLSFFEIFALDKDGNEVKNANNRVNVEVLKGTLLGIDNGDSTDYDSFKGNSKRLFSGKLLVIVSGRDAEISIKLSEEDIPIRKIELIKTDENCVSAKIHPENATFKELEWRVTDSGGVDSPLVYFSVDKNKIFFTPKGDGEIFIRCQAKNGREKTSLISYLDFKFEGLGTLYLNPYNLISASLYDVCNTHMTNGNERGIATLRDGVSKVGFSNIDFGEIGSSEIHLPIFSMTDEPFPIEIWEGIEEDGGEKICEITYTKGTKWNVYQTETFKLPKVFKGITTICFVVYRKIHIKGFYFTKIEKGSLEISASSFSNIYGDSYKIEENAVTNIGNNTVLEFLDINVSPKKIIVKGKSLVHNSIHLKFDDGPSQILEFPKTENYENKEFEISGSCTNKVSFVFLPGSNFDFESFRFL